MDRISNIGWEFLHLDWVGTLTASARRGATRWRRCRRCTPGRALLVALFLWPVASTLWRVVLVAYALAMALTLVYTGEHYVVDVVAGWLVAAVAVAGGAVVRRAHTPPLHP